MKGTRALERSPSVKHEVQAKKFEDRLMDQHLLNSLLRAGAML